MGKGHGVGIVWEDVGLNADYSFSLAGKDSGFQQSSGDPQVSVFRVGGNGDLNPIYLVFHSSGLGVTNEGFSRVRDDVGEAENGEVLDQGSKHCLTGRVNGAKTAAQVVWGLAFPELKDQPGQFIFTTRGRSDNLDFKVHFSPSLDIGRGVIEQAYFTLLC